MELLNTYQKWIKDFPLNNKELIIEKDVFTVKTDYALAKVIFYHLEVEVIELNITNIKDNEIKFFLHFELNDLKHAEDLFCEMMESLDKLKDKQKTTVLLCCTSGLTTNFFANKLNEASLSLSTPYQFDAVSYHDLYAKSPDYEIILLAPQIAYMHKEIKKILKEKLIIVIPAAVFASYDSFKIIELIIETKQVKTIPDKIQFEPAAGEFGRYMTICVINTERRTNIAYCVYDECTELESGKILKEKYELSDIEDLLDVALSKYPHTDNVYISTPGMVSNGILTFPFFNIYDLNIVEKLEKKYKRNFSVCNDANAVARGYFEDHKDEMNNFVLYYNPLRNTVGGVGIILNNKLYNGNNGLAGEVPYIQRIINYSDKLENLAITPQGQVELSTKHLLLIISYFSPDQVGLFNPMVVDIDEVVAEIAKYIPKNLIPKIVQIDDYLDSMSWGTILLGMEDLYQRGISIK